MDDVIQRLKREAKLAPENPETLWRYIAALERAVNGTKPEKILAQLEDSKIQCLICEEYVESDPPYTVKDIAQAPWYKGIECRSMGNFGSQVWDDSGWLYFLICDRCTIKHSHKMMARERSYVPSQQAQPGTNPSPEPHRLQNARLMFEEWFQGCEDGRLRSSKYPNNQYYGWNPETDASHQNIKSYFENQWEIKKLKLEKKDENSK